MADEGKSRLGRGLAALIGDVSEETRKAATAPQSGGGGRTQRRVPVEFLRANPRNPRRDFPDADLDELAASLREKGIIQPIVVRPVRGSADKFEIIAGERRWRAAQRAGLHDVPIVAVDVTEDEALQLAIIENVQRTDLNAIEEASGYQALINDFKHSHDEIAKTVGKSRVHITNTLRLLRLPEKVQSLVRSGKVSAGHARVLIGRPDAEELAQKIVEMGLSVRQVEEWGRAGKENGKAPPPPASKSRGDKDADTVALERRVTNALGLEVTVDHRGEAGVVHVRYRSLDQLDEIVRRLESKG
jgi:ParB family transcriptional regulator, chromosome partitioning protein